MSVQILNKAANTIRGLSIDAIEAANSGHPGLPMGCAELAAYLYGNVLRHNPKNPNWQNRDRFILSAGHGSMLLYSVLHLSGYDLSIDNLQDFRKLNSPCAGHPEYGECPGVETTTGPLGQGFATAVGIALGNKIVAQTLEAESILNSDTYVLAGDGCIMEGITSEAASLAGHWKLGNLTVIYDANDICLDGPLDQCFSEDTEARYKSYGWHVMTINGHNFDEIERAFHGAKTETEKPTLIIAKTIIGKGAPSVEGTSEVHGKALGKEEAIKAKQNLDIPLEPLFYVPQDVQDFFEERQKELAKAEEEWNQSFNQWASEHPEKARLWELYQNREYTENIAEKLSQLSIPENKASRVSSSAVIQFLHDELPFIMGGSADLSCSDNTYMKAGKMVSGSDFSGRNIKYGPREFAMAAIASGLSLQGMLVPFVGTFLTFSDYMRNAIRLAALMNLPVIYQFTHDSIYLGEDGPTHQPIEHVASLRTMPGLQVIRPADSTEVKGAWNLALKAKGPSALILTRQGLNEIETTSFKDVEKGAYIVKKESTDQIDVCLFASGSELNLALDVARSLEENGKGVRVVSFPCFEAFEEQSDAYKESVLAKDASLHCSIEAGVSFGWHRYIGRDGLSISIETYGRSAPAEDVADYFGFVQEKIQKDILTHKALKPELTSSRV